MREFEIGVLLPIMQFGPERRTPRWTALREVALRAEALGFDTLWTPDELLWRAEDGEPHRGVWDGISMAGAVAATTWATRRSGPMSTSWDRASPPSTRSAIETLDGTRGTDPEYVRKLVRRHGLPPEARP